MGKPSQNCLLKKLHKYYVTSLAGINGINIISLIENTSVDVDFLKLQKYETVPSNFLINFSKSLMF